MLPPAKLVEEVKKSCVIMEGRKIVQIILQPLTLLFPDGSITGDEQDLPNQLHKKPKEVRKKRSCSQELEARRRRREEEEEEERRKKKEAKKEQKQKKKEEKKEKKEKRKEEEEAKDRKRRREQENEAEDVKKARRG